MGLFVMTNASSLNAQRNLTTNSRGMKTTYQRLSSGLRINSAADDAAGLAISTRFTSQIRGLNMAIRNANDGVSLAQTAEGALQESTAILQRMRELSVQAANDVNTNADRRSINDEIDQLIQELNRIGDTTTFNSHKILNGDYIQNFVHVGAAARERVDITISDARATALGRTALVQTGTVATSALSKAGGSVVINDITIRQTTSADDRVSTSFATGSAIAKAAAINDATQHTGVTARVNATVVSNNGDVTAGTLNENSYVTINGTIITGFAVTADDSNGELAAQINAHSAATGVVASVDTDFRLVLTAVDGRNIEVSASDANAQLITGLSTDVTTATLDLESDLAFTVDGANLGFVGFNNPQIVGVNSVNSSVATVDVLTRDTANRAIEIIDRSLEQISAQRGELGAMQNRLESTINNLSSITENASASRSRILDADFASESANMARSSVLQQAGTSILAQANQAGQAALSLLG
ncbi:MAG: flagellin [Myxococcota bacterium]|nr:flagellin [Myxococcota bacterium]